MNPCYGFCHSGSQSSRRTQPLIMIVSFLLLITILPLGDGKYLSVASPRKTHPQIVTMDGIDGDSHPENIRSKRAAQTPESKKTIDTPAVTTLNDSHNQLVVYYAGLNVIVCLAKDSKPGIGSFSTLYISNDYGSTFKDVTKKILIPVGVNGSFIAPILDKFHNHPRNNGHFLFTDVSHKYIFTTTNYGEEFSFRLLDFTPDEVTLDPNRDNTIAAYETSNPLRRLFVSEDFGADWKMVDESIKSIAWDESTTPTILYITRAEPDKRSTLLSSSSLFLNESDRNVALTGIEEFEIKEDYIFATKKNKNNELELLISYKKGKFTKALFPNNYPSQHFHVADVSNGQMFVTVTHNETLTNLYIGNEPGSVGEPPKFSLSLQRIVFFKPNLTWSDSWLNDVTDEPFVELHHVEGLRGVYIASQFKSSTKMSASKFGLEHVQSVVTFDQGGEWKLLNTPDVDNDGEPIYCKLAQNLTKLNCSLHISQKLSELFPLTRAVPILSQESSIGIVMATGTVDSSLKGHLGVYMSTDGAVHWKQILQGNYLYTFGDHGGIIVAVKYYKQRELTNNLLYSTDEGNTWNSYQFYPTKIRVLGLMTEPGEATTVFFIFGSAETEQSKHSWVLIKIDMKNAFDRNCTEPDYKMWSPWDANPGRHCLLGRTDVYRRRQALASCYNSDKIITNSNDTSSFRQINHTKQCLCKRSDFECDFGYMDLVGDPKAKCIKDQTENGPGVKAEWCKPGDTSYNRTKGYRKIPGDTCEEGDDVDEYLPTIHPCSLTREAEFMLVAKRDSVLRIDLNDFTHMETLPLDGVRSVVALDFDIKNNCIFWSDVHKDQIFRLHLDGKSEPELLVSQDLKSVEGLAFDWMSKNLYFVDGILKRIEVIRTDVSALGRLRKQILGAPLLDKPRGIALHPAKGYLFWTDWSAKDPHIGRSNLDGSNSVKIIRNNNDSSVAANLKWPNSITVDILKNTIYWVDAGIDKIFTADLDGGSFKVFLSDDGRLSHPFAVAILHNFLYWDDWTSRSIYTTRTDIKNPKNGTMLIQPNISRLMDLKVYGVVSQNGSNSCSTSSCLHLCLANSSSSHICTCPDGLSLNNGTNECLCPDGKPLVGGHCGSTSCNGTDMFKCKSGFCIPPHWKCDGQSDCGPGDNSDEDNCKPEKICDIETQFRCVEDGKCIPEHWRCDFDIDCLDGSDEELNCTKVSQCNSDDHFQCDNKLCVLKKWQCDGEDDCGDGSDEKNCTTKLPGSACKLNEFQCEGNKRCISNSWVCDGDHDCNDGSDEKNCNGTVCPQWKFACKSGECIMRSWMCDGDNDCSDGSDEVNCTTTEHTTPPPPITFTECNNMDQMFACAQVKGSNVTCIPKFWVHDGVKDCPLGDDEPPEENTTPDPGTTITVKPKPLHKSCAEGHFHCKNDECIYNVKYCDGYIDCSDESDEPETCPKEANQISMRAGNVVGITITVIVVIGVLIAALGVFVVRHRRLQISFLNFARSHYSSNSGAAIFQQSMEEEMDSPVIRGFSDDEPLLVI